MKKILFLAMICLSASAVFAQRTVDGSKKETQAKPDKIIFAVLDSGQMLEPIAFVESGQLVNSVDGGDDAAILKAFSGLYYKPKTKYDLIFGGIAADKVDVISNDPASDCGKNMAQVAVVTNKTKYKGFVMALATNIPAKATLGTRRPTTTAERTEIEALVRAAFTKEKTSAAALKVLRYHNLTVLDVDGDGKPEIVGSYYVSPTANERRTLFFIAEKNAAGKYAFTHSEYEKFVPKDVMSNDIKDLDTGIYHRLLLDVFDVDGDGTAEIFTTKASFESNSFAVFRRKAGKWAQSYESSNYHCAY